MPEIIKNLSPQALFIIILVALVLIVIAVIIISLRGKLGIKIGNKSFNLGGGGSEEKPKKGTKIVSVPPSTAIIPQKRSCGDCVMLLMGEREKYELKIRKEQNRVMKTQMTFAEQKLIEIQTRISTNISGIIHQSIKEEFSVVEESVQYKLIYGLLKDALFQLKDEIRRSFKENGFYNIDGSELSQYLRERTLILSSMLSQYMRNIYPDRGGVLQVHKILTCIENEATFLTGIINDIYLHAKEVRLECDEKREELQIQFSKWVDDFIK